MAGSASDVTFQSAGAVLSSGAIYVAGGAALGTSDQGGSCQGIELSAVLVVASAGDRTCDGGASGGMTGGNAGPISLTSDTASVTTTGTLSALGGASGVGGTAGSDGAVTVNGVAR